MIRSPMVTTREASGEDAPSILALAKACAQELGPISHHRAWLLHQIDVGEVFVAVPDAGKLLGFVSFHHNRLAEDDHTTVHYLCTDRDYRGQGIGKLLMDAVATDARLCGKSLIMLRCPNHLPANRFYKRIGYTLKGSEMDQEGGPLNVWTLHL